MTFVFWMKVEGVSRPHRKAQETRGQESWLWGHCRGFREPSATVVTGEGKEAQKHVNHPVTTLVELLSWKKNFSEMMIKQISRSSIKNPARSTGWECENSLAVSICGAIL